ncbi:MAG TPA: DUF72 domain-containing protein, partial [Chloroflexota bacterium]|nr:DUF72 domain-containing protein [Chloroflexota bacterium]
YSLQRPSSWRTWYEQTPPEFVFAVKAARFITHMKKLKDVDVPLANFFASGLLALREKLGPILVQLPPDLQVDVDALDATLRAFPPGLRIAVEPRHETWWNDDVRRCLERHNASLCWADRHGAITPLWRTADWGYLRFHEGKYDPWPFYTDGELAEWVDRIVDTYQNEEDVYVYFNNDPGTAAIDNAITFAAQLQERGLEVTRVPADRPDLAAAQV